MNKEQTLKIIEDMQLVVAQMKIDDIEENPDSQTECFDCACCGKNSPYAGSIQYGESRFCNDCVLIAETGFALKKIENVSDVLKAMEDKRLEEICEFIKQDQSKLNN